MKKNFLLIISIFMLLGCAEIAPKPEVKQKKQFISKKITKNHYKIDEFRRMMEKENIEPIYIYIDSNLKSEVLSSDIPNIKKMTHSLLSDFGEKVKIVTSKEKINTLLLNSAISERVFLLDGAITAFDKSILSQMSSVRFNIKIGSSDSKKKNKNKFKNKKKTSQMIADLYFKQKGIIIHKTTSSIMIRETSTGYDFGLSMYGMSLGVNSYKNIKDGLGLSVRKIIESTLIELVSKAISVKSYQVMPEIQRKKTAKSYTHLSNFDFCSDMNRIIFYVEPLKDIKFKEYGMSYESEHNKLLCLRDLYKKSLKQDKKIKIVLKTIIGENMSPSKAHKNARIVRKEIFHLGIPRDMLIIKNKYIKERCDKDIEYCDFIKNRIEIEKVILR